MTTGHFVRMCELPTIIEINKTEVNVTWCWYNCKNGAEDYYFQECFLCSFSGNNRKEEGDSAF